ncbi:MAG: TlpA disulfide reductase family protein [Vicinamibacterales bacterium]
MNTRWIAAAAAAIGLAAVALNGVGSPAVSAGDAVGACDPNAKPANLNFTLKDLGGRDVKLSSYKGKVILVNFWATWCGPCKIEIPWFNEFHQKYKDRGLVVLGISADDTVEQLKPFVAEYKMSYPVLVGKGRDDVQEALGPVWGLPTTIIISRDGKACHNHVGLAKKADFEKGILGLL